MNKIEEAQLILSQLMIPQKQQNNMCCLVLLALANLTENSHWVDADNRWMRIHDIIMFIDANYGVKYAENSRETIRKQALHHFRNAAIIEDNSTVTNSPNYSYHLTQEFLKLIQSYETSEWNENLLRFGKNHDALLDIYTSKKTFQRIPVIINNQNFEFSKGAHNQLQKSILEEFAPRFAPGAECLYVGDTAEKSLYKNDEMLLELGFSITLHDKMPDIVLFSAEKNWLYFIEAVTSVGPMSPSRLIDIRKMTANVSVGRIFITAFPDQDMYRKFIKELAWDTEVWIASEPDHMIHLNGDRFLGPH